jgi:hypothetical protein
MAVTRPQVGDPDFVKRVREVEVIVERLQQSAWDFSKVPEAFARQSACDVMAKEVAVFHDGERITMIGRLVMAGVGTHFNLMGSQHADSEFMSAPNDVIRDINLQLGTRGLLEFDKFRNLPTPQRIYFYNRTKFYQPRDLVFWHLLHGAGVFPTSFEIMRRNFAAGKVVHNNLYRAPRPSSDPTQPNIMSSEGSDLFLTFPSKKIEFLEPSVFGGVIGETMHIEYLLTPKRVSISHPRLPLTLEGYVSLGGLQWHLRRFSGITPKIGLRDSSVPPEGQPLRSSSRTRSKRGR